jgi:hypothetical protein
MKFLMKNLKKPRNGHPPQRIFHNAGKLRNKLRFRGGDFQEKSCGTFLENRISASLGVCTLAQQAWSRLGRLTAIRSK